MNRWTACSASRARRRADLAQGVAEEQLAPAFGVAADAPGHPLGGRHPALADLGHELGPLGVLGRELRGHSAWGADPVVRVDHERADAVGELLGDPHVLRGEEPPRLVGGRHRVVGAEEGDLVDATIAQCRVPVAAPDPRDRRGLRRPRAMPPLRHPP